MQSGGSQQKVPDLNCEVQDLLWQLVDLKREVADLRSGGIPQWRSQKFSTGGASVCSIPFCPFTKSAVQSKNVMTYHIPLEWLNEQWWHYNSEKSHTGTKNMYFPDKGCVRPLRHYATGIPHQFNPRAYDPSLPPEIRPYNPQQGSCLEKDNARNDVRCTQARKTTHGLDGQHQDMDRTPRGRVSQNDGGQR